jgi:hypothetical protein
MKTNMLQSENKTKNLETSLSCLWLFLLAIF